MTNAQYPDDENGDVLRAMATDGVDLTSRRIIDFDHCFPDEASARSFCEAVSATVLEAKVLAPEPEQRTQWEVQCRQRMLPTHAAISETEERLGALASEFGGFADGWGTLSRPDGSPAD